jgi:hypothetical protein
VRKSAIIAALVLLAGTVHADELPRATDLVREPRGTEWVVRRRKVFWTGEFFVEGSPLGWSADREGSRYAAFARTGPGLIRWETESMFFVAGYVEVSRISLATVGAQLAYFPSWDDGVVGLGIGALSDLEGNPGGLGRIQLWVLGLEAQVRQTEERGIAGSINLVVTFPLMVIWHQVKGA